MAKRKRFVALSLAAMALYAVMLSLAAMAGACCGSWGTAAIQGPGMNATHDQPSAPPLNSPDYARRWNDTPYSQPKSQVSHRRGAAQPTALALLRFVARPLHRAAVSWPYRSCYVSLMAVGERGQHVGHPDLATRSRCLIMGRPVSNRCEFGRCRMKGVMISVLRLMARFSAPASGTMAKEDNPCEDAAEVALN
ncbi:hypothetical protein B0T21DRAFT_352560 [Apiosordaria backusii]|uniref:Uncharacterized protein n=1 Tax=Apiosordaria backusii TaxID=314023 RepID=A0AA40DQG3_9PEZI|nr:hypothetical protein B0T21DRAFT_352560 [Apiosordaria backusii]